MATIKSYSDLQQSKKLAEILPLESADMHYVMVDTENGIYSAGLSNYIGILPSLPCWSFTALLSVASTHCDRLEITLRADKKYNIFAAKNDFVFRSFDDYSDGFNNPIDACVAMIEKLNELNLL